MDWKDLINPALLLFAPFIAAALQVGKNIWTNSVSGELPRWADALLAVIGAVLSWFCVSRWALYYQPQGPRSILDDVPLQTLVLFVTMCASHFFLKGVYGAGRPIATASELRSIVDKTDPVVVDKAGVSMTSSGRLAAIVVALLLAGAAPAIAGTLPYLSFQRLSGGATAQAAVYSNAIATGNPAPVATFAPKGWLSYSLLDEVSAHGSAQFGLGGVAINEFHGGGSVRILKEDPVRVAVGVDAVHYSGKDAVRFQYDNVVEYSLRFSKVLKRTRGAPRLGLQFQPGYVPANENFVYRLGLNWHVFGGEVIP
jgi:hypothetical protein